MELFEREGVPDSEKLSSFQRIWKQADMTGKHAIRVWMEDN